MKKVERVFNTNSNLTMKDIFELSLNEKLNSYFYNLDKTYTNKIENLKEVV